MLIPHLHFDGECSRAMELYVKALDAVVHKVIYIDKEHPEQGVMHAEMSIHGQRIMLNDNRSNVNYCGYPFVQLILTFDEEARLKHAFHLMKDEQRVVSPMEATDYSPCTVGFWDRFGIRWGFMVEEGQ
jgi:PhnB protein